MKIGYARVSSNGQNLDRQQDALKQAGVERLYEEKASGKDTNRPVLKEVLGFIREGDVLVVSSFDRLARSTRDLLDTVDHLKNKGASLVTLRESIDTGGPGGKLILTIFGALAQFERETIKERQKEGIESAKARGKRMGRPRITEPENWNEIFTLWNNEGVSAAEACRRLNIPKSTFYKLIARMGKAPERWADGKPDGFKPAVARWA